MGANLPMGANLRMITVVGQSKIAAFFGEAALLILGYERNSSVAPSDFDRLTSAYRLTQPAIFGYCFLGLPAGNPLPRFCPVQWASPLPGTLLRSRKQVSMVQTVFFSSRLIQRMSTKRSPKPSPHFPFHTAVRRSLTLS